MQVHPPILRELFYGRDSERLFLRIDFCKEPPDSLENISLRLGIRNGDKSSDVVVNFSRDDASGRPTCQLSTEQELPAGASAGRAALGKILELEVNLGVLGIPQAESFEFQVSVWQERLPLESLPLEGWLSVPVPV